MPTVELKLFAGQGTGRMDGQSGPASGVPKRQGGFTLLYSGQLEIRLSVDCSA